MKIERIILAAQLTLASAAALAGPNGTLLCDSAKPYDFLSSDTRDFSRFGVHSTAPYTPEPVRGKLINGQGIKAISANGLMLVPSEVAGRGRIELRKQGRTLRIFDGWLQAWDLWGDGQREKFMFTVWNGDPDASPTGKTWQTRYIVDGDGKVLFEKRYQADSDNENGERALLFSADGDALHEEVNAADPSNARAIFNGTDMLPLGKVTAPKGQLLSDLVMVSGDVGFAIINDQLHRYVAGQLTPMQLGPSFKVHQLTLDARSRRILAQGTGDFVVMDLAGTLLFRFTGALSPDEPAPAWVSPRLAIDGSVGFMREGDELALVATRQSGYSEMRHVPLGAQDWNRVACFTPASAALLVDDQPVLVKF